MIPITEDSLFHSCALAAFVDALPLDDEHMERSRKLAYKYYEEELKREAKIDR